ncbi:hypothetical protein FQA47_005336 [Oryzias melastigma]|uniref:Uncharacterized protein n=1 Tax=Oryzias melastigma TaxID=30732 RepID=A0A834CT99_ORYME|nr:hypothetical protein FQA47_005336 [Oryzias melastigma]
MGNTNIYPNLTAHMQQPAALSSACSSWPPAASAMQSSMTSKLLAISLCSSSLLPLVNNHQRPSCITYLTLLSTRNFSILLRTAHEAAVEEETPKDDGKVDGWREER